MKSLLLVESTLTVLTFAFLFMAVDCKAIIKRVESTLARLEKRPRLFAVCLILVAITLRLSLLSFFPVPQPRIHDEFSYLLAADTFIHRRLANATHPHWQFFESFHINQVPSYASMYPPAQGFVLAAGHLIGGSPWIGVLFSTALMCGLLCWMLEGYLPTRWALIGGAIGVVRISLFSYWGNSYWGGSVAAIGGLLILGSMPRLLEKKASILQFLLVAVGVLILANSRPFEGLLLCVAVFVAGLTLSNQKRSEFKRLLTSRWLTVIPILLVGFGGTGFYNWRVTGNPTLMPYKVNEQQYAMAHPLLWQTPTANVEYRHEVMKRFYVEYYDAAARARSSISEFLELAAEKLSKTCVFFLGPIFFISLITLGKTLFDRRIRFLILTGLLALPGILAETWFHPHYVAPFIGIIYVVILQGIRHIRFSRRLPPRTRYALITTIPVVMILMSFWAIVTLRQPVQGRDFGAWCCNSNGATDRYQLIKQLQTLGGQHLVFVEYTREHDANYQDEWVYNAADIDTSPVVFARHMSQAEDERLIQYFSDRRVWHLLVGKVPLKFESNKAD